MLNSRIARERAERQFLPPVERNEKGSAMGMIAADAETVRAKTLYLRELRLARDATVPAPPVKKRAKAAPRRKA